MAVVAPVPAADVVNSSVVSALSPPPAPMPPATQWNDATPAFATQPQPQPLTQLSPLDEVGNLGWMFDFQLPFFGPGTSTGSDPAELAWLNAWHTPSMMATNPSAVPLFPALPAPVDSQQQPGVPSSSNGHAQPRRSRRGSPLAHGSDWPDDYEPPQNERATQLDLAQLRLTREGEHSAHSADSAAGTRGLDHAQCHVSPSTRDTLLDFIATTGMHQWSPFCLSSPPPDTFLSLAELNELFAVYFERLHPHIPFIHGPTFDSAATHPLLMLSIVANALSFISDRPHIDSTVSRRLSTGFADMVRIGIVSAAETGKSTRGEDYGSVLLMLAQSWLHQQSLGLGCGDKRMYQFAERNRGGLITFARRSGLLRVRHTQALLPVSEDASTREQAWKQWTRQEAKIRLAWSIFVYDQQICVLLDTAPMLTPSEMRAELPRRDRLWSARNADEWAAACASLTEEDVRPTWLQPTLQRLLSHQISPTAIEEPTGNRFTVLILATVLYRLLWDTTKTRRFLRGDEPDETADAASLPMIPCDENLPRIFHRAIAALSSIKTSQPAWSAPSHAPLLADVRLLQHICTLHFAAAPTFLERCIAAAGRYGLNTELCLESRRILERQIRGNGNRRGLSSRRRNLRRTVASAAQIVACAMDHESPERDSLVMVFGLFHAALVLWAYVRYHKAPEEQDTKSEHDDAAVVDVEGEDDDDDATPRSTIQAATLTEANGVDLAAMHASQTRGLRLWIAARYRCEDGTCRPFKPGRVILGSIACIEVSAIDAKHDSTAEAAKVLQHVSLLLNTLPWGLASSFAAVLRRLAVDDGGVA